jgi:hypothetical protein
MQHGFIDDVDEVQSPILHKDVSNMFYGGTIFENVQTRPRAPSGSVSNEYLTFKEANFSIILDNYDTMFSSFDATCHKDYRERTFSADFLSECKRRMRPTPNLKESEIQIALPKNIINEQTNDLIRERLQIEFKEQFAEYKNSSLRTQILGITFFFIGLLMIAAYSYLTYEYTEVYGVWFIVFLNCIDPIAWFAIWGGCDIVVFQRRDRQIIWAKKSQLANARIVFKQYIQ